MNEAGNNAHFRAEAVPLREKLRRIRDSDHPAAPDARNMIQIMDTMEADDPAAIRALALATVLFDRNMCAENMTFSSKALTPSEIAAIFGLGGHPGTDQ